MKISCFDSIRRLVLVVAAVLGAVVLSAGSVQAQEPDLSAPPLYGPMVVSGSVVDQFGRPVPEVSMLITESVVVPGTLQKYSIERVEKFYDGWFRVECEPCSNLRLLLLQDGYNSGTVEVTYLAEADFSKSGDGPPSVDKGGLVVVLEKAANPVRLRPVRGLLEVGPEWEDTALVVAPGESALQAVNVLRAKAETDPVPFIELRPTLAGDGSVVIQKLKTGLRESHFESPAPAILDFSAAGPGAGLVVYEPSTRDLREAWLEMKTAPEGGYEAQIELQPGQKDLYFYCFVDGQYGKGRVTAPRIEAHRGDRRTVAAAIEIQLNPDGSRNLETVD